MTSSAGSGGGLHESYPEQRRQYLYTFSKGIAMNAPIDRTVRSLLDKDGPTMMAHWEALYSVAYWEAWDSIPPNRTSIKHAHAHEAGLKAVVLAVAESVSAAIKNAPLIERGQ
jgi:hypothetical protein